MMHIRATYINGIDDAKDQAAFVIAKNFGAKLQGSGCWLHAPFERDLEWSVMEDKANPMIKALEIVGFEVVVE